MKTRRVRDVPIMFYVSKTERDEIVKVAEMKDMTISELCRQTLLKTASYLSCKKDETDV